MDILQYTFFQNALIGAFLASILCGFIGTYIVTRRLVFISGGITHASFGGIGIGVFSGINPILSAMVFAILSAFGVQWISRKKDVRKDSAIAMFWTLGMSVGIICCFLTPGFMPDLPSFLFGSILAIDSADLWLLGILTLVVALLFTFLLRPIQNIAFDSTFARSQHLPVVVGEEVGGHLRDGEQTDGEYDAHHLEGGNDGHGDERHHQIFDEGDRQML
jgi:zinc transport system permease protein